MSTLTLAPSRRSTPPTPRPRRRADGSIYYQVRYRILRSGKLVQTSQSFDEVNAAARWAVLLHQFGATEAERILTAQLAATAEVETVVGWCRRYVATRTGVEPATRRRYLRYIDRDIAPYFTEHLPLEALSQEMDAAWVTWLEHEVGNAPKTISNKHGFLSAACSAAVRRRPAPLIPYNPCADTLLPRAYGAEIDYFEPDEWEFYEQLLKPRWRSECEFAIMSMARPSEQAALQVGDIDPATGAVRITRAYKYDDGALRLGQPKSRRGVRTTYVPLETVERLDLDGRERDERLFATATGGPITVTYLYRKAFLPATKRLRALDAALREMTRYVCPADGRSTRARRADAVAAWQGGTGYLRCDCGQGPHCPMAQPPTGAADLDDALTRHLSPFSRRAHWDGETPAVLLACYGHLVERLLEKKLSPYTLRHTGISWRLQLGEPIWVVSRDAGHESITTTDARYGHISGRASAASARTIAGRLPRLRAEVVDLARARRRREVRTGELGEICAVPDGYEAIWMDRHGLVHSAVFADYDHAVDHVARYEAGDHLAAAA
ncbi:tyrosine-type recombinase/integrase [Nocardia sp. NPDC052566]|uniref:tyrosine-type recombinase/integrase n=1 Tax=Nocardia sp. NPDC052566 TaxID=3364330 RepID=UPI0037C61E1E